MTGTLWVAIGACALAVFAGTFAVAAPGRPRVARERLDPTAKPASSRLGGAADDTSALATRLLRRTGQADRLAVALERAGIEQKPGDVVVVVGAGVLVGAALGSLIGGMLLGVLLAAAAPLAAWAVVSHKRDKRQAAFADQLDESLHLMASSLRAGHSVLRALDAVSRDTEAPTSVEFSRVVNETRVGRDVNRALEEVAERTGSMDFAWVVQAIAIHREVGGNLAEVLDRVSATIRERSALRRHARALSAEGRMSGVVMLAMPVVVVFLLSVVQDDYWGKLTGTSTGIILLLVAVSLMAVGGFWLRAVVKVRF
jgi:tight adherence protein B